MNLYKGFLECKSTFNTSEIGDNDVGDIINGYGTNSSTTVSGDQIVSYDENDTIDYVVDLRIDNPDDITAEELLTIIVE